MKSEIFTASWPSMDLTFHKARSSGSFFGPDTRECRRTMAAKSWLASYWNCRRTHKRRPGCRPRFEAGPAVENRSVIRIGFSFAASLCRSRPARGRRVSCGSHRNIQPRNRRHVCSGSRRGKQIDDARCDRGRESSTRPVPISVAIRLAGSLDVLFDAGQICQSPGASEWPLEPAI